MRDDGFDHEQNEFSAPPVRSLLDLSEKVVIVTGGGSGVGRGIALRFAEAAHASSSITIPARRARSLSSRRSPRPAVRRPPTRAI